MKDYLGNELSVGDKVITVRKNYREFTTAVIVKITSKQVTVEYNSTIEHWEKEPRMITFITIPEFVVKID